MAVKQLGEYIINLPNEIINSKLSNLDLSFYVNLSSKDLHFKYKDDVGTLHDLSTAKEQVVFDYGPQQIVGATITTGGTISLSEDSDLKFATFGNLGFVSLNIRVPSTHITGAPIYVSISGYSLTSVPSAIFKIGRLINKVGSAIDTTIVTLSDLTMDFTSTNALQSGTGLISDIATVAAGDVISVVVGRDYVAASDARVLSIDVIF
ncbi:MAG: hypothetical protein COY58_00955 [Gammaproteobacteria bacterium CG_4_10_14_0_8_um_filter_38_16]|nr:MAG: hypothetical protein COY58_00955 [Gammaproteobacteria bacterium CG_4_10_14_0_8_um_filter_38_16]